HVAVFQDEVVFAARMLQGALQVYNHIRGSSVLRLFGSALNARRIAALLGPRRAASGKVGPLLTVPARTGFERIAPLLRCTRWIGSRRVASRRIGAWLRIAHRSVC